MDWHWASNFANWVFRMNHFGSGTRISPVEIRADRDSEEKQRLELGKVDHDAIEKMKRGLSVHLIGSPSEYVPQHIEKRFVSSGLSIGGEALVCKPDVVLVHTSKSHRVIIERKTTRQTRQFTGNEQWDNIEAQLWCYSHINEWSTETNITLVGEIWQRRGKSLTRAHEPLVWHSYNDAHRQKCKLYFEKYKIWVDRLSSYFPKNR